MGWAPRRLVTVVALILIIGLVFAPLVILNIGAVVEPDIDLYSLWCWSLIAAGITCIALLFYMVAVKKDIRTVLDEEPED